MAGTLAMAVGVLLSGLPAILQQRATVFWHHVKSNWFYKITLRFVQLVRYCYNRNLPIVIPKNRGTKR